MNDAYGKISGLLPSQLKRLRQILDDADETQVLELPLQPRPVGTQRLPLSFAQERFWFLEQVGLVASAYNMPTALRLRGPLDSQAMERSFAELTRRHESLRTRFEEDDSGPVQVVQEPGEFRLDLIDLSAGEPAAREDAMQREINERSLQRFDLTRGSLLRAALLKLAEQEHVLLITTHHIVSDGWSTSLLIRELAALYLAFSEAKPSPLPEPELQYPDYAFWQREWLQGDRLENQLTYWKQQLSGAPAALELPTDRPRPAVSSYRGARVVFTLPKELSERLEQLARTEQATLFMVLVAAYQVLLWRLSGQDDIVVGSPIAGRTRRQTESLIGCFLNTLVLRTRLQPGTRFRDMLQQVREVTLGAYAHQDLPFERLVAELQPERDLSRQPLCQVGMTLQNLPRDGGTLPGLKFTPISVDKVTAKFDLWFLMNESPTGLRGSIEYSSDLFDRETIERWAEHFQTLLQAAVADPDTPLSRLTLLAGAQRERLLARSNALGASPAADARVDELIAAQAARTPQVIALIDEEGTTTFAELERQANQLAHYLISLGVGPDVAVGVCIRRSARMVTALLAILKAGGAYLPLDERQPPERLSHLVRASGAAVLLSESALLDELPSHWGHTVCIDDPVQKSRWEALPGDAPASGVRSDNLAYVIYTSGSTGTPKGVAVEHANLAASTATRLAYYGSPERIILLPSIAFDSSVATLFWALCSAATLVLPTAGLEQDAQLLGNWVERHQVRTWLGVPSLYDAVLDLADTQLTSLRTVVLAGETLPVPLVHKHRAMLGHCALFNEYGPTEATVWASVARVDPECSFDARIPIGAPIANARAYVLDEELELLPMGVIGELHLGGTGVVRGYLNAPGLTAQSFAADPYGAQGGRIYRTGDLVRWNNRGELEFIGRRDQQVKIRGHRIELSEIEAALLADPLIGQAAVITLGEDSDRRLVAYIVASSGETSIDLAELSARLRRRLPEYMMPPDIVTLDAMPLNPNGKIDRHRLPAPTQSALKPAYLAPRTPTEQALSAIWSEILKLDRVGIEDNFFQLGGHSLLATRVVAHIRDELQIDFPITLLFSAPTIAEAARVIDLGLRIKSQDQPLTSLEPGSSDTRSSDPGLGVGFHEEVI
ncbi:non-ribosomal peptide synthetase [Dyella tabacisoli]|uniref:Amino acid adenylation domain-containing protein n=1 Tax=Dyella tabacisoli TaxID=2282381 RepID=A0A369UIP3_9GAMM|nr:non-ribosomal peptide synthetase [Dyella tabacisoli]RDD80416.1 amino acid adenylation domain-containing protein [Dyella tabacisoli]